MVRPQRVHGRLQGGAEDGCRSLMPLKGQERERVVLFIMSQLVLRRRSWPFICGIAITGLAVGMLAAVWKVTSVNGFRTGWQGIPIYFALAGACGRIANCKIVLRGNVLLVVNPLSTHYIPKDLIRGAVVGDDGTLEVTLDEDRSVSAFAFGGSLIDRFKGTSGEAGRRIGAWLRTDPVENGDEADMQRRWTQCMPADLAIALSVATAGAGAIWMVLSGS